ncbi:MAG: hypothetical protein WB820_08895 [Rhodoplanes sp.]
MTARAEIRPILLLETIEQLAANLPVGIDGLRKLSLRGRDRLNEIGSAHNPDQFAIAQDRNALDPIPLQQCRDFTKGRVL